jgi:dolichol-phosphate mannosyltransferase
MDLIHTVIYRACSLDLCADVPVLEVADMSSFHLADDHLLCAVVPTRNEEGNVREVSRRLGDALRGLSAEVVFVDDSDDGTPEAVAQVASTMTDPPIRLVHRSGPARLGGLGGAVVTGFRYARAEWVCVLDGDLQHPPELVPDLLAAAIRSGCDLAIATRYGPEGRADGLTMGRSALSSAAAVAAGLLFPQRLRGVSDPMSGFFLVRRSALNLEALRPDGFKILLEILVATPWLSTVEVGFTFAGRHAGRSKAGLREGVRYLRSLIRLRLDTVPGSTRPRPVVAAAVEGR